MGSKVERVKRRREKKTRRAQMEMVDWALLRSWAELVRLRRVLNGDGNEEDGEENIVFFLEIRLLLLGSSCSSGKKTKKIPIPQPSVLLLLFLGFAVNAIPLFGSSLYLYIFKFLYRDSRTAPLCLLALNIFFFRLIGGAPLHFLSLVVYSLVFVVTLELKLKGGYLGSKIRKRVFKS